jgi:copper resistance protein C
MRIRLRSQSALAFAGVLAACTAIQGNEAGDTAMAETPLARSVPADGATVRAPQTLSLTFREPVRLAEVTITGPSGEMPMMVTAAGEQTSYTLPLVDLEAGTHELRWRALRRDGAPIEGRLSFTVH